MPNRADPVEFAELDTFPVVWMSDGQAWWYISPWPRANSANPEWRRLSNSYANAHSCRLAKETFDEFFPDLPPMPADAIAEASGVRIPRDARPLRPRQNLSGR